MKTTETDLQMQEVQQLRITDVRGPEEQKAESERRKEKLTLIYNTAKALYDLIKTAGRSNNFADIFTHPYIEQYTDARGDKYRSKRAKFNELVTLGETLGFILPNEFLATGQQEALQNLSQLIHEIEQNLLPELGMKQLAAKVETVLNDQGKVNTDSLKAA